jgi:hypothetical protein
MEETAEPIAAADLTLLTLADDVPTGGWIRRLQPERPVRTMTVVVVDIDPKHPLEVAAPDDQQPVKTLGADRPDPSLRVGVRVRRLYRRQPHPGAVSAEHAIEATGELRVVGRGAQGAVVAFARCTSGAGSGLAGWPQAPSGLAVTPARWTRRVSSSMKTSTDSRGSPTVSTVKQSQATISAPC